MDIALAVFRLATAGGIERHAARLAELLRQRGHDVTIYTTASGSLGEGFRIHELPRRGFTNHGRMAAFGEDLQRAVNGRHAAVVGLQKLPGLDVLVCGDWCFADRRVNAWKRLLPRYRTMLRLEKACCGPQSKTRLLMLAEPQAEAYRRVWAISPERLTVLPPTLASRRVGQAVSDADRQAWRSSLAIAPDEVAWLWLGQQPRIKGLDRAIEALAKSPRARLLVAGADAAKRGVKQALKLAGALGCRNRIALTGKLEDSVLDRLFAACDLLVHPARLDVTGTVIVEALGMGLPVIVTENCGYSVHVLASGAGVVLPADAGLEAISAAADVSSEVRRDWSSKARAYVQRTDLTSGLRVAAEEIEKLGGR